MYKKIIVTNTENLSLSSISTIILLVIVSLFGIVLLQEGVRRIPLLSSKQLNQISSKDSRLINTYIPLRLNQAGVMPIILTTTVLVLPSYISNLGIIPIFELGLPGFTVISKFLYWIRCRIRDWFLVLFFNGFSPDSITDSLWIQLGFYYELYH